jgi:serine phosphatase RsbU (regulator of sigma subunit)
MRPQTQPQRGLLPVRTDAATDAAVLLDRLARLQAVTAALSAASSERDVANALLEQATRAAGATCAVLGIVEARGVLVTYRLGLSDGPPALIAADATAPLPTAVRTAQPVLLGTRAEWEAQFSPGPRGDFDAFAAIPVAVDGRVVACLGFGFPERRYFDLGDLELFEALALQGGQALARAWLYEKQAQLAGMLERELLPSALPAVAGIEVAVRYRPLGGPHAIGGDFYDLLATPDGGWMAVIGDVCGKGVEAAIETLLVRHTLRALAGTDTALGDVVHVLNREILQRGAHGRYCTLVILKGRAEAGGHELEYVLAGHPPPLIVRRDGRLDELERCTSLVGALPQLVVRPRRARLAAGESIVLYTDGITEARGAGVTFGIDGLRVALCGAAAADAGPEAIAARVESAVAPFSVGDPRDDMALMVIAAG